MDDDGYREETIRANESMVVIAHTYPKTLVRVDFNIMLGPNPGVKVKGQLIICT